VKMCQTAKKTTAPRKLFASPSLEPFHAGSSPSFLFLSSGAVEAEMVGVVEVEMFDGGWWTRWRRSDHNRRARLDAGAELAAPRRRGWRWWRGRPWRQEVAGRPTCRVRGAGEGRPCGGEARSVRRCWSREREAHGGKGEARVYLWDLRTVIVGSPNLKQWKFHPLLTFHKVLPPSHKKCNFSFSITDYWWCEKTLLPLFFSHMQ
jgi:hypothetical protein